MISNSLLVQSVYGSRDCEKHSSVTVLCLDGGVPCLGGQRTDDGKRAGFGLHAHRLELESKLADLLDEEQLAFYRKFTKSPTPIVDFQNEVSRSLAVEITVP